MIRCQVLRLRLIDLKKRGRIAEDRKLFYMNTTSCDTCHQPISNDIREEQIIICESEMSEVDALKTPLFETYRELEDKIEQSNVVRNKIVELSAKRREIMTEMRSYERQLDKIRKELDTPFTDVSKSIEEKSETEKLIKTLTSQQVEKSAEKHYLEICKMLLKDEGIKSKIIRQYLPLMNNLINKYLDRMGANYSFHLDEQFGQRLSSHVTEMPSHTHHSLRVRSLESHWH